MLTHTELTSALAKFSTQELVTLLYDCRAEVYTPISDIPEIRLVKVNSNATIRITSIYRETCSNQG